MTMTLGRQISVFLALLLFTSVAHSELVQEGDFTYLGAFKLPQGQQGPSEGDTFGYGGQGLTFNPGGHSLFLVGHVWHLKVAEISLPPLVNSKNPQDLQTASLLQPFADVTEGRLSQIDPGSSTSFRIGGLLVDNDRLIVAAYSFYDADGNASASHFVSSLDLSQTGDVQGPFAFANVSPGAVGGYMTHVPTEWIPHLGGPAITGLCCVSIISRSSYGPAAFAFTPADLGTTNPVPNIELLFYSQAHPLASWGGADDPTPYFNQSTKAGGVVVVGDSVLFIESHGEVSCYGSGAQCNDPYNPHQGTHAVGGDYHTRVVAYHIQDLIDVRNGAKQPWEPRPYAHWDLDSYLLHPQGRKEVGGVAYDPATGIMYFSELCAEANCTPVIHGVRISAGSSPPTDPPPLPPDDDPPMTSGLIRACAAPPLPSPTGPIINVSTEGELQAAVDSLTSGTTILIAPGTYNLSSTLWITGGLNNVTIRGSSDTCNDVVLVGHGMSNLNYGNVPHGIWVGNASNVLIANLTIRDVYFHPIQFDPNQGAQSPHIYNVHLIDAGEQFVKSSASTSGNSGVNNGVVEYSIIEYTGTARSYYTNGVDVHQGTGWIVRHNLFRNIRAPQGTLAGPAVLMWNGSRDSIVENNLFLNTQRGIALGLNDNKPDDHTGGIVRNNFFYRSNAESGDTAIIINNSGGTKVLNNTLILSGTYPNCIEYRFPATSGIEIRYNLTDEAIQARDGASGTVANNVTNAQPSWFVDLGSGNLHLLETATSVIDQAQPHPDVPFDYDLNDRSTTPDIGADEFVDISDLTPPLAPTALRLE